MNILLMNIQIKFKTNVYYMCNCEQTKKMIDLINIYKTIIRK